MPRILLYKFSTCLIGSILKYKAFENINYWSHPFATYNHHLPTMGPIHSLVFGFL
eukprot:SAG31_NODE_26428_length_442_cov_1.198251_1_plen_54_part_01